MEFVTRQESWGFAKGYEQGKIQGLLMSLQVILSLRFGAEGEALMPALEAIGRSECLDELLLAAKDAATLDGFQAQFSTTVNGMT